MADVSEVLAAVEDAMHQPRGKHGVRWVVSAPVVLGERGRPVGASPEGVPLYGYTKRQCRRIRGTIYAAARADLHGA